MNRVQLIGRLGRDPEGGPSGKGSYATFSLATNEYWTDRGSGELVEHTEWHQLICYDRLAEIAREFLAKGSEVYVEGRQRTTHWTDKDGMTQRVLEIRIDEMVMLRRAPEMEPVVAAAKAMASIETMMKDVAVGQRNDITIAELAEMLNVVRTSLVGDGSVPNTPAPYSCGRASTCTSAGSPSTVAQHRNSQRPARPARTKLGPIARAR